MKSFQCPPRRPSPLHRHQSRPGPTHEQYTLNAQGKLRSEYWASAVFFGAKAVAWRPWTFRLGVWSTSTSSISSSPSKPTSAVPNQEVCRNQNLEGLLSRERLRTGHPHSTGRWRCSKRRRLPGFDFSSAMSVLFQGLTMPYKLPDAAAWALRTLMTAQSASATMLGAWTSPHGADARIPSQSPMLRRALPGVTPFAKFAREPRPSISTTCRARELWSETSAVLSGRCALSRPEGHASSRRALSRGNQEFAVSELRLIAELRCRVAGLRAQSILQHSSILAQEQNRKVLAPC